MGLSWMAWTWPTALFFIFIALSISAMAVWWEKLEEVVGFDEGTINTRHTDLPVATPLCYTLGTEGVRRQEVDRIGNRDSLTSSYRSNLDHAYIESNKMAS